MGFLFKAISVAAIFLSLLLTGQSVLASVPGGIGGDSVAITNWSLSLVATIGMVQDSSATFGVRPDATTDYDAAYDVPRPPDPPGDYIEAYFPHTGGSWPSLLGWKFASDFTTPANSQWWLVVESTIESGLVTLSWDTSRIQAILGDITLWMRDSSADLSVNMTAQQSYSFTYAGKRSFCIWSEVRATYYDVSSGWNMVSLPRIPAELLRSKIFPSAASSAFSYGGAYVSSDTLRIGEGYWLKFEAGQTIGFTGSSVSSFDIPVRAGWNMIGALTEATAVPTSGIITSQFFGYKDNYFASDTLKPGNGYWVKVSSDGSIPVGAGTIIPRNDILELRDDNVISLSVSDRDGSEQALYLTDKKGEVPVEMFELPPIPPADAFDARFYSQRYMEWIDVKSTTPVINKIRLQSVHYPLQITVALNDPNLRVEINDKNQPLYNSQAAGGSNSVTIIDPSVHEVTVVVTPVAALPMKFELSQNYPNPFNPSTVVGYTVPERSFIQLKIENTLGQEVAMLYRGHRDAGPHTIIIDGPSLLISSGVYFYVLDAVGATTGTKYTQTKKLIFIK